MIGPEEVNCHLLSNLSVKAHIASYIYIHHGNASFKTDLGWSGSFDYVNAGWTSKMRVTWEVCTYTMGT